MLVYTYAPIKLHNLVLAHLINRETNSKISKIHQQVDESHIRKVHPQNGRSVAGRELKCQQEAPIGRIPLSQCWEKEEDGLQDLEDGHSREQAEEDIDAEKLVGTFMQKGIE